MHEVKKNKNKNLNLLLNLPAIFEWIDRALTWCPLDNPNLEVEDVKNALVLIKMFLYAVNRISADRH